MPRLRFARRLSRLVVSFALGGALACGGSATAEAPDVAEPSDAREAETPSTYSLANLGTIQTIAWERGTCGGGPPCYGAGGKITVRLNEGTFETEACGEGADGGSALETTRGILSAGHRAALEEVLQDPLASSVPGRGYDGPFETLVLPGDHGSFVGGGTPSCSNIGYEWLQKHSELTKILSAIRATGS